MKNVMKLVLAAAFVLGGTTVMAQQIKLGYVNSQELFAAMPERDSAFVKLEAYATELQDQLDLIRVELNTKFQDYQKNMSTYTDGVRNMRESEIQSISTRLQESQQMAEEEIQRAQGELLTPVFDKLNAAIEKVSKDNGLTAVFDVAAGAMIYHDTNTMVDMLPLVKRELGIAN